MQTQENFKIINLDTPVFYFANRYFTTCVFILSCTSQSVC